MQNKRIMEWHETNIWRHIVPICNAQINTSIANWFVIFRLFRESLNIRYNMKYYLIIVFFYILLSKKCTNFTHFCAQQSLTKIHPISCVTNELHFQRSIKFISFFEHFRFSGIVFFKDVTEIFLSWFKRHSYIHSYFKKNC